MRNFRSHGPLRVDGEAIVDGEGSRVVLRGVGLGGWMNMENFITGYPATESQMRAAVAAVLGPERSARFFDRLLTRFFEEGDARAARRPRRQLRADPGQLPPLRARRAPVRAARGGLRAPRRRRAPVRRARHLQRDRPARGARLPEPALALRQPDAHRRFLAAPALPGPRRAPVAGVRHALSRRAVDRRATTCSTSPRTPAARSSGRSTTGSWPPIREIDADHIVFVDGNTYSTDFSMFAEPYENAVYACHDYARAGMAFGGPYPGETQGQWIDRDFLEEKFLERSQLPARDRHADLGRRVRPGLHGRSRARRAALPDPLRPARHLRPLRRRVVDLDLQGRRPAGARPRRAR